MIEEHYYPDSHQQANREALIAAMLTGAKDAAQNTARRNAATEKRAAMCAKCLGLLAVLQLI